ncbi:UNVERIFIED_CONTAM: hypothetical protein FKN15_062856 [Acipenser sinensis]
MSGFHHCVTCQTKLLASDPHEDCVACLGPEHAASALADRSFCALFANFQLRTIRQRARKAVGSHSPSSGSSYILSVPPSSTATPPVTLRVSRSPSQLTAGQCSPDCRHAQEHSHSPSIRPRGSSPRRERSLWSRSRSLSPRRRGRSCSPRRDRHYRDKSGVAELTSKMSQFMDVMMGQQSLLMSLTSRAPPADSLASQPAFQPQPLAIPVVQQSQGVWDVDAISRDASEGELLLEEDSLETDLASRTPVIPCGHWWSEQLTTWELSGQPWNYLGGHCLSRHLYGLHCPGHSQPSLISLRRYSPPGGPLLLHRQLRGRLPRLPCRERVRLVWRPFHQSMLPLQPWLRLRHFRVWLRTLNVLTSSAGPLSSI